MGGVAMTSERQPLFVKFRCEHSRRTAVIAEEIDSVWLYLSAAGNETPERDCWLLNTTTTPREMAFYRERGAPPPAPIDRVEHGGVLSAPGQWSVIWSASGDAVAALLNALPIGFVSAPDQRGWARYMRAGAGSWAKPWDEDTYRTLFVD
jgi:hypothetical protein